MGTFATLKYGRNEKMTFFIFIGHERKKLFWGITIFIRRVPPSNFTFLPTSLWKGYFFKYVYDSNATEF